MLRTLSIFITGRSLADFLSLTKPRTVALHLLTAMAAMILAGNGRVEPGIMWPTLAGGGLVTASANVLNCYFDRELDALMPRTSGRPLPSGRLKPFNALVLAVATGSTGFFMLAFVGWLPLLLALGGLTSYVLVYTLWLKRRSRWSAVLSSAVGAFPPLTGWAAVTGHLGLVPLLLTAIIALWTVPHYWSLALSRKMEYESAGIPALPGPKTGWLMALSALFLFPVSLLLVPAAEMSPVYIAGTIIIALSLLALVFRYLRQATLLAARQVYYGSILYLVSLFALILVDGMFY